MDKPTPEMIARNRAVLLARAERRRRRALATIGGFALVLALAVLASLTSQ